MQTKCIRSTHLAGGLPRRSSAAAASGRLAPHAPALRAAPAPARSALVVTAGYRQNSNSVTKRRSGSGLPPIRGGDEGGGGGGGDGWGGRFARNVLPNLAFLGLYFAITSYGGDGWGNGPFGGGGDGGGGGGGGGDGGGGGSHGGQQANGGSMMGDDQEGEGRRGGGHSSEQQHKYVSTYHGGRPSSYR